MFIHNPVLPLDNIKSITSPNGKRVYSIGDNKHYPSITTLLGDEEKPWLDNWRKMLGEAKAKKETQRAANRGTMIHEITEKYLKNEQEPTKGYDAKFVKGFNQIKYALNHINNIRAQEVALYSDKLRVAGRVDLVGEYDGVPSIVDFKTSNNAKTEEMCLDYFLQCTAYAIMFHEQYGISIENIIIIISVERGFVPLVFKKTIEPYVVPLLQRINTYYNKTK